MELDVNRLRDLHKRAEKSMNSGDFDVALDFAKQIQSLGTDPIVSCNVAGLLIDIGSTSQREEIVKQGIGALEKDFDAIIGNDRLAAGAYYNRGNGYYALYAMRQKDPFAYFYNTEELSNARAFFRKALEYRADSHLKSQVWVNIGNCLDNVGRGIEALDCYEQALNCEPRHAMAIGNKGVGMLHYASVAGKHRGTFIKEAYSLLSKALEIGVQPEAASYFQDYLKKIEIHSGDKDILSSDFSGYPGYTIKSNSKIDIFLIEFCMKHRLYLNPCDFCQNCDAAIGDTAFLSQMVVSMSNGKDPIKQDPFLRLSSYLNQIKQDYVTARLLLVFSQYKGLNLDFVDKNVRIINTMDYSIHNIRIELIKKAFKSLADILDKVAFFINDYLNLDTSDEKVDFHSIWYDYDKKMKKNVIKTKIQQTNNISLNALFDLHLDFEYQGAFHHLKKMRNALTHRFINVREMLDKEDDENISPETLRSRTIELACLTRSSILYLLQFVDLEERKNKAENFITLTAQEIPDNLKYFNVL
ncbi:LA2681 family HEPN domain-containing protein [Chloroflexota bacterium]